MKNLKPEELKKGEVYFMSYGESNWIILRFKKLIESWLYSYSYVHFKNSKYTFQNDYPCLWGDAIELRAATQSETAKLVQYEAESDVQYKEKDTKRQEFFNFFSQEHGLDLTETGMDDIIHEVEKLQPKPTETPLTAERLPDDFKEIEDFEGCYEKEVTSKIVIGVSLEVQNPFIYISEPRKKSDDIHHDWETPTEEKLQEIHKIFTGKEIEFKELELEPEINGDLIEKIQYQQKQIEQLGRALQSQALVFAAATTKVKNLEERLDKQILKGQSDYQGAWKKYKAEQLKVEKMDSYLKAQQKMHNEDSQFYNVFEVCINALERITKEDA